MITQKSIQEVIETARIEEVVEDFVSLKRAGVNMKGLCPFHNEKTPSFTVSPAKNIFKCFGCGRAGDSVKFVMEHEKFSFPESIRWVAGKYNIELEETKRTDEEEAEKLISDSYYLTNQFAADLYVKNLFETQGGRDIGLSYLKERGLLENTIKKFKIGFALQQQDQLLREAKAGQYQIDHLETLGLVKNNRDFFRNRIMFPILNLSGKVIGFGGRTLSNEKKIPKYLNSIESEIYIKRKTLYGLYWAKQSIRKEDECILVEGYTDVIALQQSKIENVVAASGTALTKEQILLIKRYTPNIKIIFDGDSAGIKAALRGLDLILEMDMNVNLVTLPENEDPDSFMKSVGHQKFKEYLDTNAKDFIFFKTEHLLKEIQGDPIKKTIAIKDIVQSIAKIPDTLKRTLYIKECSLLLDIDEETLTGQSNQFVRQDLKKKQYRRDSKPQDQDSWIQEKKQHKVEVKASLAPDLEIEKGLAAVLIQHGSKTLEDGNTVTSYIIQNLEDVWDFIDDEFIQELLNLIREEHEKENLLEEKFFLHHSDDRIRNFAIEIVANKHEYANWQAKGTELQSQKIPEENFNRESEQVLLRFKGRKLKKNLKILNEQIKACDPNDSERIKVLLLAYTHVNTAIKEIDDKFGMVISK